MRTSKPAIFFDPSSVNVSIIADYSFNSTKGVLMPTKSSPSDVLDHGYAMLEAWHKHWPGHDGRRSNP